MKTFFIVNAIMIAALTVALAVMSCTSIPSPDPYDETRVRQVMSEWLNIPDDMDFFYDEDMAREVIEKGHGDY